MNTEPETHWHKKSIEGELMRCAHKEGLPYRFCRRPWWGQNRRSSKWCKVVNRWAKKTHKAATRLHGVGYDDYE